MCASGQGQEVDYGEAVRWYRKAAEQGLPQSQKNLAGMYSQGLGVDEDPEEALRWLQKALTQGNSLAPDFPAGMNDQRVKGEEEYAEASGSQKAVGLNHSEAEHNVGGSYTIGQGVKKIFAEVVSWFRGSAGNENAQAQDISEEDEGEREDSEEHRPHEN